jgi:hypothetical protein
MSGSSTRSVRSFEPPAGSPRLVPKAANSLVYEWTKADNEIVATVALFTESNGWAVNGGSACVPG